MLRTNNKRLHSNLWTLAHFLGSAVVFLLVVGSICFISINTGGGASTANASFDTRIVCDSFNLTFVSNGGHWTIFTPICKLFSAFLPFSFEDDGIGSILYSFFLGLDFVLWFNIGLWFLQLLVFIPDACFHWLEKKKED